MQESCKTTNEYARMLYDFRRIISNFASRPLYVEVSSKKTFLYLTILADKRLKSLNFVRHSFDMQGSCKIADAYPENLQNNSHLLWKKKKDNHRIFTILHSCNIISVNPESQGMTTVSVEFLKISVIWRSFA